MQYSFPLPPWFLTLPWSDGATYTKKEIVSQHFICVWPDCRPVPWAKHTDSLTSKGEANGCLQQQFPLFKGQGKERSYLLVLSCLPCSAEGLSRSRSTLNLTIVSKADRKIAGEMF